MYKHRSGKKLGLFLLGVLCIILSVISCFAGAVQLLGEQSGPHGEIVGEPNAGLLCLTGLIIGSVLFATGLFCFVVLAKLMRRPER